MLSFEHNKQKQKAGRAITTKVNVLEELNIAARKQYIKTSNESRENSSRQASSGRGEVNFQTGQKRKPVHKNV